MTRRTGLRPWQMIVWQNARWVPMVSLGIHVDLHTPVIGFHLPLVTVEIGRVGWWGVATPPMDGQRSFLRGRVLIGAADRWNGHTDNCDHALAATPQDPEA